MMLVILSILLISIIHSTKIFLFGGILINDNNEAYQKIISQSKKPTKKNCDQNWQTTQCPKVAVITSACPNSQCGQEQYYIGDQQQAATGPFFISLGMAPRHCSAHIDNYKQTTNLFNLQGQRNLYLIQNADIIYFNGGDQSRHVRVWLNDDGTPSPIFSILRRRVVNNQVILIGVSAGTAVHSKTIFGGGSSFGILYFSNLVGLAPNTISDGNGLNDVRNGTNSLQYSQNGAKIQGFGFVDFQIDTHFDIRGRLGRLIPATYDIGSLIGVGIDQVTCFYYKDGVGEVLGEKGVFIVDLSNSKKIKQKYFHIENVRVNYLTSKDLFDFKTKKVTTSKTLLNNYRYNNFTDSEDILAPYECTTLLTRLVDQRYSQNLGKTTIPEQQDYPIQTPKFNILFYRGLQTRGYYDDKLYCVVDAIIDISAQNRSLLSQ